MTKRNPLPTYERVRELFTYDPESGILFSKVHRPGARRAGAGQPAGTQKAKDGRYLKVGIDGKIYRTHLIIWLWMTGKEPKPWIDHEDTVKSNNRWTNLREATKSQNQANIGLTKRNTSGYKGVFWYKAYQKWTAQIWKDKKAYFLGYFDTAEEAHEAYKAKAKELFGEYARMA